MKAKTSPKTSQITISSLIILLLAALLLTGCGGGFFKGNSEPTTVEFQKGTRAISMSFMENAPPGLVYVGNEFGIGLSIKNEGAHDITGDATIEIVVPDQSAFHFKEGDEKQFSLTGKSLYIQEGESSVLFFPMQALCFPGYDGSRASILKNYTRKIKAMACYRYETGANVDVCIDARKYIRQVNEQSPCNMQDISLSGGQGGPVGVTRMSPKIIPIAENQVKLQLDITIEKVGGNDIRIFHPDLGGTCKKSLEYENQIVANVRMGDVPMICEPALLKLKQTGVTLSCTREVSTAAGTFMTPITVELAYQVYQGMIKSITVQPPGDDYNIDCNALRKD